jgi:hypothetical protein
MPAFSTRVNFNNTNRGTNGGTVLAVSSPPAAASSAGSIPLLVQAMASLGASAAVSSAPGAVLGGADTPQHALLTIPH